MDPWEASLDAKRCCTRSSSLLLALLVWMTLASLACLDCDQSDLSAPAAKTTQPTSAAVMATHAAVIVIGASKSSKGDTGQGTPSKLSPAEQAGLMSRSCPRLVGNEE